VGHAEEHQAHCLSKRLCRERVQNMMTSDEWNLLESRVSKLEKQNRWLKAGWLLGILTVACAVAASFSKPTDTLAAQRFALKSAKGQVWGELTTEGDYPTLTLRSPNGEKEAHLSPIGISFSDKGLPGKLPLAHLGNTGLYLTDANGHVVAEVGSASATSLQLAPKPQMTIFNEKAEPVWKAP
jgi:hypothetical protein